MKLKFIIFFLLQSFISHGKLIIKEGFKDQSIGSNLYTLKENKELSFNEIINSKNFIKNSINVPNLGISIYSYWIRFTIVNKSSISSFLLTVSFPTLDEIDFFYPKKSTYKSISLGESIAFNQRKYKVPSYIFDLEISPGASKTYYLRIKNTEQVILPISVCTKEKLINKVSLDALISGIYIGIIFIIFFYNLFVFFSTKDKSYLYYVLYVMFIGLTHSTVKGYTFQYIWPNSPYLQIKGLTLFASFSGITASLFTNIFLNTKIYAKRSWILLRICVCFFSISIIMLFFEKNYESFQLMQITTSITTLTILIVSFSVTIKGFRPGFFFCIAWSILVIGVTVFLLKEYGILPYNLITEYAIQGSAALEMALLSFALADRINVMRRETTQAKENEEKERREKHEILEKQAERLKEEVEIATRDLKLAQTKLVQAEKTASMAQMAAGVAHEINNPINISNTNLNVLERDTKYLRDYIQRFEAIDLEVENVRDKLKEVRSFGEDLETDELFAEMEEALKKARSGLDRTVNIVQGLKNYSKVDTKGIVVTDINADIKTVVDMQKSSLGNIQIELELGQIPTTLCDSQKMIQSYQVFIDNAILAIKDKGIPEKEGLIKIKTEKIESDIMISFSDNGVGIKEEIQQKIFDPFFTTRPVGNKGLGLSIALGALQEHNGNIDLDSKEGEESTFILKLPIIETEK